MDFETIDKGDIGGVECETGVWDGVGPRDTPGSSEVPQERFHYSVWVHICIHTYICKIPIF